MNPQALRRTLVLLTAGVVVVGVTIAVIVAVRPGAAPTVQVVNEASPTAPGAAISAPAPTAPAAPSTPSSEKDLAAAADALGFRPTTAKDVGLVEDLPPDTTLLPPSKSLLAVGAAAPEFALQTALGQRVRLSDYRGKTVLLEFFATWCPHCQAEVRHLMGLFGNLPRGSFAFLSVNADSEDAASLYAYDRFFKIPWPTLLDPGSPPGSYKEAGGMGPVTRAYGVSLYPTFYIIDAKGRVAWRGDREQPDMLLSQQLHDAAGG